MTSTRLADSLVELLIKEQCINAVKHKAAKYGVVAFSWLQRGKAA